MSVKIEESRLRLAVGLVGALVVGMLTAIALATGHDTVIYAIGTNIVTFLVTWALAGGKRDEVLRVLTMVRNTLIGWLREDAGDLFDTIAEYLPLLEKITQMIAKFGGSPEEIATEMIEELAERLRQRSES